MNIPESWTFKTEDVARNFDTHVREQLPWYDLATSAVVHLGRHYIPRHGLVYDIGASTGNIGRALAKVIEDRSARFVAIEESQEMAEHYCGGGELRICDATDFPFEPFDFAVCFLTLMFFPIAIRRRWHSEMRSLILPGGALVIVDKVESPTGYIGTVLRRLAMSQKINAGVAAEEIIKKELSLSGYQRPLAQDLQEGGVEFFRCGEFAGWVFEKPE
jgi:tRNA (cmo5U34)-methyltransferase